MRTAEIIIKEYLEQGYSLPALRVLAESRSEPLRSNMYAILDQLERAYGSFAANESASASQEDAVFFVADEEETAVECTAGIDFNLMADTAPAEANAASEESVAEILIGETDGSDIVALPEAGIPAGMDLAEAEAEMEETVALAEDAQTQVAESAEAELPESMDTSGDYLPQIAEEQVPAAEEEIDVMAETASEILALEQAEMPSEEEAALPEGMEEAVEEEAALPEVMEEVVEEEAALPEVVEEAIEEEVWDLAELPEQVESLGQEETPALSETAEQALDELLEELMAREQAEEACTEQALPEPAAPEPMHMVPASASLPSHSKKESRRERRRRDRAEKKMRKKQRRENALPAQPLPEIILAQTEGTDTLIPEQADHIEETVQSALPAIREEHLVDECPVLAQLAEQQNSGIVEALLSSEHMLTVEEPAAVEEEQAAEEVVDEMEEEQENNVIVFRSDFPVDVFENDTEDEEETPRLRMLSFAETQEIEEEEIASSAEAQKMEEQADAPAAALPPLARLGLLRAFVGIPEPEEIDETSMPADHVILSSEPAGPSAEEVALAEAAEAAAAAEAAKAELEKEYQLRLDEFANQLTLLQASIAAGETLARERQEELQARQEELTALQNSLSEAESNVASLTSELEQALQEDARKQAKLEKFKDVLDEHERLYKEFEDLRVAYNEVVVEVMPGLQNERDDLALTVERQCETETRLRSSLGSARKRLAVGYSMGAAACVMLVALPVFNWLRSGSDERELAFDRQRVGELREQLEKAEMRNLENEKHIFNLERKVDLQLAELEEKNRSYNSQSDKRAMEMAMARNGSSASGTPIRVSDMALSGPMDADGLLRYNDVRDPAGNIDNQVALNRSRRTTEQAPAPSSTNRVAVSSRARTSASGTSGALRPAAAETASQAPTRQAVATASARQAETKAKVKAGEGVAQVVYRVLGTRDPEVINWVIRENNIKKDRRGNPRIYPDQELRLPKDGRLTQSASR